MVWWRRWNHPHIGLAINQNWNSITTIINAYNKVLRRRSCFFQVSLCTTGNYKVSNKIGATSYVHIITIIIYNLQIDVIRFCWPYIEKKTNAKSNSMKLCLEDHQAFVSMLNYLLSKYNAHCKDFQKHINFLCLRKMALFTIISHTFYTRLVQQYKTHFYRCNIIHALELRV